MPDLARIPDPIPPAPAWPETIWRVALPLPLPRLFDYRPVDGQAASAVDIGLRVRVPFGSRELVGVVAEVGEAAGDALAGGGLKQALAILDPAPLFSGELLDSLRWLARYTHAPLGEIFATALPTPLRQGEPLAETHAWAWQLTEAGQTGRERLRAGSRPRRLADLLQAGPRDEHRLDDALYDWRGAARALAKRALAERIVGGTSAPTRQPVGAEFPPTL
ncbi:MAG: primosomal protein N' family DNA-binding protein, partial [Lysobacter sp.]